jgi:hypothetical protein
VEERDSLSLGTNARCFVDETNASGSATVERAIEIVDDKADVVDAGPPSFDESTDRRVGDARFEQLDERITGREAGDASSVRIVERDFVEPQDVAIEGE